ncbi:glycoside hydrolase family 20 zincin-like fold domain-containing protein [Candidatus Poribacteria bacterium]
MERKQSAFENAEPFIFPYPRKSETLEGRFVLDEQAVILLPENPSQSDTFLARFLSADLVDRYQVALGTVTARQVDEGKRFFLMGTIANPLVKTFCNEYGLTIPEQYSSGESYVLHITDNAVLIAGADEAGAFYGLQSLRQLISNGKDGLMIHCVHVEDSARKPFRGIRLYLPGRENITFFKRFIRDFAAFFKYNKLIIETNAAIRLDKHPELNAGWYELARCLNYTRRDRPEGIGRHFQDSTHHDTGDFGIVEKEDVADIVRYAAQHHIEVIPEIPSLTHAYYMLTRHRELAEIVQAEWPDTYCPNIPESYDLYFDVLDEYIEVMQPKTIHIGHDEWRMPMDICPRCKGKDYMQLFVEDVRKIHEYLTQRGVRTAMWGDHLLTAVRGDGVRDGSSPSGYKYRRPGALRPQQVEEEIPKDILLLNWFWNESGREGAEANDIQLEEWGFQQVYGNFTPAIATQNYEQRSSRKSVLGGAVSAWQATREFNFGKDLMDTFVGCAPLLWSDRWPETKEYSTLIQSMMPTVRRNLKGETMPTEDGEAVTVLDISEHFNVSCGAIAFGNDLYGAPSEAIAPGDKSFSLGRKNGDGNIALIVGSEGEGEIYLPTEANAIPIGEDPSSLLFLHACDKPSSKLMGHSIIFNFPDCADLLGWYEVVYEDGFIETIPIRYGVNILEWQWARDGGPNGLCYEADPVNCAADGKEPVTFFAFEWLNPRFGKIIQEIRLKGSKNFRNFRGQIIASNGIALLAMSIVKKRPVPPTEIERR